MRMKRKLCGWAASLGLTLLLAACERDMPANNNVSASELASTLTQHSGWRVAEFREGGQNKTAQFNQLVFSFGSGGIVQVAGGAAPYQGTYLVFTDDGKTELAMNFNQHAFLQEFTDDWYFISQTNNELRFEDQGDILVFRRQ